MENKEARKQIEAALGQFFLRYRYAFLVKVWDRIITHLAEEVIVVGCEVRHIEGIYNETQVWHGDSLWYAKKGGFYQGKAGKALAIIISREEDEKMIPWVWLIPAFCFGGLVGAGGLVCLALAVSAGRGCYD